MHAIPSSYPWGASGVGAGSGTVTSVDVALTGFTSDGPVTGAGTITLTVSSGTTFRTAIGIGTGDSPQLAGINLGHASDTTLTRSAAGKMAVEGKAVPLMSGAFDLVLAGPTAARTWTGPDADATLVTQGGALGTPSSGTLTNTTGYTSDLALAENKSVILDPVLSADGKFTGTTIAGTAGATLVFGDLCYRASTGKWLLADADAISTAGDVKLGFCVLAAAADTDPTVILLHGNIRADARFPTFTVGVPVYASTTPGDVTATQPSGTDDVIRVVGHAATADSIDVEISKLYFTHV
jgi:hypothetical protein